MITIVIKRALSDASKAVLSSPNLKAGPINQTNNDRISKPIKVITILLVKKLIMDFIKYSDNNDYLVNEDVTSSASAGL